MTEEFVAWKAPQPGLVPVRIALGDGPGTLLVWLYGVPRVDDFLHVPVPDAVHYGPVYRVEWGSDGIPTIYLR